MKKGKKLFSALTKVVLSLAMVAGMMPSVHAEDEIMVLDAAGQELTFDIVTTVEEYGQDVSYLIIDAGKEVYADGLDKDSFTVTTTNYNTLNGSVAYEGGREVLDVYVTDTKSVEDPTGEGQYIVLALKHGFNLAGSSAIFYSGCNYELDLNYEIAQNDPILFEDGTWVKNYDFVQGEKIDFGLELFDLVTFNDQFIRVYMPDNAENLPVVIWNHGAGETYRVRGEVANEGAQLYANEGGLGWITDKYPAIVIAPQRGTGTGYSQANTLAYIESLAKEGKADLNRVYVGGCSAGGGETLSYLRNFPTFFAAAVPVCPAGSLNAAQSEIVADIPMWFFQSADDPTIKASRTQATIANLEAAKAKEVLYTEVENLPYTEDGVEGFYNGHWSWILPLNNYYSEEYETNMHDWLFAHTYEPTARFDIETVVTEYGSDTAKVIIDMKEAIDATTLTKETFTVNAKNISPLNGSVTFEGTREVLDATVNEAGDIVLTLKTGMNTAGATAQIYSRCNYKLNFEWSLVETGLKYADGTEVEVDFVQDDVIWPVLDEVFDLVTFNDQFIRVYMPANAENLPVVVWNHGAGETYREQNGVGNEGAQIFANEGGMGWITDKYPAIVIAPQRGTGTGYSQANTLAYIESLAAEGKADLSRVYVSGCSAGGNETLSYLRNYPGFFAAAVPICPAGAYNAAQADLVSDIPMWFFHAADDPTIAVSRTQGTVANLLAANAKEVKYTEVPNLPYTEDGQEYFYNGHWSWILPLNNYYSEEYQTNVHDWLFSKVYEPIARFDIETEVMEYGSDTAKVIIDMKKAIDAETLTKETFTVNAKNISPLDGKVTFEGTREVLDATVNEAGDIVLTLKTGMNTAGATAQIYSGCNYKLNFEWTLTQAEGLKYADGSDVVVELVQDDVVWPVLDEVFDLVEFNGQIIRVYMPSRAKNLPVVIWNHGAGETYRVRNGVANEGSQIFANEGGMGWITDEYPAIVIAPQRGTGTGYSQENTLDYVDSLVAAGQADANRVYVSGCSAGGGETLSYLRNYPYYFAAAVPICPAGSLNAAQADTVAGVPQWYFQSADDPTIKADRTRATVANLEAAGAKELLYTEAENLPYTEDGVDYTYNGHWSWILPLNNYYSEEYQIDVHDWLFSHVRDLTADFDIITKVTEYGQDTYQVVIDMKAKVDPESLDLGTFSVNALNTKPTNGDVAFEGAREIVAIEVNEDGDIVLTLKTGFTTAGASAIFYSGRNFKLDLDFTVTQNTPIKDVNGREIVATYTQDEVIDPVLDEIFDLVWFNDQFIRVYIPEGAENLPVVVWNHGAGEGYRETNGVNNEGSQLYANEGGLGWITDKYPAIVVVPQRGNGTGYSRDNTIAYINHLGLSGQADLTRVYVAGCSAGGGETLNYLREFPSYFAAAVPVCPAGSANAVFKDVPMWFFQATADTTVRPQGTRDKVEMLKEAGAAELLYTEVENLPFVEDGVEGFYDGHWSWILPLNNYFSEEYGFNVHDWLFAHTNDGVNTRMLQFVTDKAEGLKAEGATANLIPVVAEIFEAALTRAQEILATDSYRFNQDQINEATIALQDALELLDFIAVDKSDLIDLVELVKLDAEEEELHTPSTWAPFAEALAKAEEVLADDWLLAGQDEAVVEEAWANLIEAWTNLRLKADKTLLKELLAEAGLIEIEKVTEESAATLNAAMAKAVEVIENVEATEAEVAEAVAVLSAALDVEYLNADAPETETPETPETPETDKPETDKEETKEETDKVETFDSLVMMPYAVMAISAAGAYIALRKED